MRNRLVKIPGVLGLALGLSAGITASVLPARNVLSAVLAGSSFLLLLAFFILHFEALKAFSRKRSTQFGLNSILMIALFVFIVTVFNLMIRQYYFRLDLSSTSNFSLSYQTKKALKLLDSVVHITVFGQEGDPAFIRAHDLLEGYRYLNRNVAYSVVDLDKSPQLAKEFGVDRYRTVVVQGAGTPVAAQGTDEQTITNAIIKATRKSRKKIYFTSGHGERDIKNSGRAGMSKAAARLNSIGYETVPLALSGVDAVPGDADALVLAGPREKFNKTDSDTLQRFISRGGKLLALIDSGYDASPITGRVGIHARDGVVIDPSSNLGGKDSNIPLVASYPDSPVTRDFGLSTVFPGASPLLLDTRDGTYEYLTIAVSSPGSKLVKGGRVIDNQGSYILVAGAGSKNGKDIVVVFGSSDFASNAFFDVAANGNLFLNCINWMAGEAELVSITPGKDDFIPLYLTSGQSAGILYLSVIGVPASVFGSGLFIWWKRRRL